MDTQNLDKDIWKVIDSYFKTTDNYLSQNQLDSYNTFIDTNIPKTLRQFNPIVLPYAKMPDGRYFFELQVIVGGTEDENGEIINDGKGIYIGKPIIQEIKKDENGDTYMLQKILFPNEARLKNITYKTELLADVYIKLIANDGVDKPTVIKKFQKVPIGYIPIMLQSKVCSLHSAKKDTLRLMGECEYDQGGYFIIDGKEKVIVSQERQVENKIYITEVKGNNVPYKYQSEIRSTPENKFQPARITKVYMLNANTGKQDVIAEDTLRVTIPSIDGEIPIFIVMRALGITSDEDILKIIVDDFDSKLGKTMLDLLRPSIVEGGVINNQLAALDFLEGKISAKFMTPGIAKETRQAFLADILKNYFLPHVGTDYIMKSHFLGYMVNQMLLTRLQIKKPTDRDSYMYKRIDQSGFLIAAIFRDLYFRIKNRFIEILNVAYNSKDPNNSGEFWNDYPETDSDNKRNYKFYHFIGKDEIDGFITIEKAIDRKIMDDGFMYAFKNCWGLKDAPCKEGVVQDFQRLSYVGSVSHLRRINTPLSASAKVRAPHQLHPSTWGIMCPPETPDGANIGVRKNLSIMAMISAGSNSNTLLRALYNSTLESIHQVDFEKNKYTKVFLNEKLVGYTRNPAFMHRKIKLLKRNALINVFTSIAWYIDENIIKISTDSGRAMRPLLVLGKNNELRLTNEIIKEINDSTSGINWKHLVGGFRNKNMAIPYSDNDPEYYYIPELENDLDKLENLSGVIEYIDTDEENTALIALTHNDLSKDDYKYSYCEIHPAIIFGVLALTTPLLEMNQAPRNQFSAGQGKQALGVYATNFRNRMDNKGQILYYPQRSIVKSKMEKYIFTDELPNGLNAIVAIGCFSGYNQEDSIIFNKSSVERGLFRTTKFRTYSGREEVEGTKQKEKICNPDPLKTREMKSGNYKKLDENGIVMEGVKVNENDVIIGKCVISNEKDAEGNEILIDNSDYIRRAEDGFVDKVYSNVGNDNQRYVKIRVRKEKVPEIGDKFCSRHGQKGTIGTLLPQISLPVSKLGITPDIIVNSHAFPSRMTIAQFMELLLGKSCTHLGSMTEIAPFSQLEVDDIANLLEKCGFEKYGNEVMYSGITGEMLKVNYFIGPTFYQRLTHQVSDKYQSRDEGMKTALVHQPVGGRSLGGAGRLGEMERDAILSHGIISFLKESYMERSDKYKFIISTKTGMISVYNRDKKIYRDFNSDDTAQYIDDDNNVVKRQMDPNHGEFVIIEAPYALKLFLQEIEAMGVAPRIIAEKVIQEWKRLKEYPKEIKDTSDLESKLLDTSSLDSNKDALILSLHRFYNIVKDTLLDGAHTKSRKNLIDITSGYGADLYKWMNSNYRFVLGLSSKDNIYKEDTGAIARFESMKEDKNEKTRAWANTTKVHFVEGDPSIPGFTKSGKQLNQITNIMNELDNNKFGIGVSFFSLQSYFNSKERIAEVFKNLSNVLKEGAYLLITIKDGNLIYNKLKEANGKLEGKIFNEINQEYQTIWNIQSAPGLDLSMEQLPSNTETFTEHKIIVDFLSNKEVETLVHPTTLLSIAKSYGFSLPISKDIYTKFKYFKQPTGNFDDILKQYIKLNENDKETQQLLGQQYRSLREFSDLHRYFILEYQPNDKLVEYSLNEDEKCENDSYIWKDTKYPEYNIPVVVSLDPEILKQRVTEIRSHYGNTLNRKKIKPNKLEIGGYGDVGKLVSDLEAKLSSDVYKEMGHDNFKNAISFLFKYIKLGIYVKIVNSQLVIYSPMFNVDYNVDNLMTDDITDVDEQQKSWIKNIKLKLGDGTNAQSVVDFLNKKYSLYEENELEYDRVFNKVENIFLDGCRVYFGNNNIYEFGDDFLLYKHMFQTLLLEKSGQINDCEFVINVLNHPLYNIADDGKMRNPFDTTKKININGKLIPVLSLTEKDGFLDISLPSSLQWKCAVKKMVPPDCDKLNFLNNTVPIDDKYAYIAVQMGLAGCGLSSEDNQRIEYLTNEMKIEKILNEPDDEELQTSIINNLSPFNIASILKQTDVMFYPNLNYIFSNKINYEALFNLYIDGFGTDDWLTISMHVCSILLRLKSKSPQPFWYEKLLVPYDFNKSIKENQNADHILVENLYEDLANKVQIILKEKDIARLLINNLEQKRSLIFSKEFITDYLQVILNKISNNIGTDYVKTEIFEDIIDEPILRETVQFKSDFLGILIGKESRSLKKIQYSTDTKIEIHNEQIEIRGIKYQDVVVTGGKTSVMKALERINKINNSSVEIIKVPNRKVGVLLGKNMKNKKKIEKEYNIKIFTKVNDDEIKNTIAEVLWKNKDYMSSFLFIKIVGNSYDVGSAVSHIYSIIEPERPDRVVYPPPDIEMDYENMERSPIRYCPTSPSYDMSVEEPDLLENRPPTQEYKRFKPISPIKPLSPVEPKSLPRQKPKRTYQAVPFNYNMVDKVESKTNILEEAYQSPLFSPDSPVYEPNSPSLISPVYSNIDNEWETVVDPDSKYIFYENRITGEYTWSEWYTYIDDETGMEYYYNTITEETTWTPPRYEQKDSDVKDPYETGNSPITIDDDIQDDEYLSDDYEDGDFIPRNVAVCKTETKTDDDNLTDAEIYEKYDGLKRKFSIITTFYNKTKLPEEEFSNKFYEFISNLNKRISDYKNKEGFNTDYDIIIMDYNYKQIPESMFKKLLLPKEVILDIVNDVSDNEIYYKLKLNKGALYNIGFNIARKKKADWVIFHEPFLLPNDELLYQYFQKPLYATNISHFYTPLLGDESIGGERFGVLSVNINTFIKTNGYPTHIWTYDGVDNILDDRMKYLYSVKKVDLINRRYTYKYDDMLPNYHNIDYNIWTDDNIVYNIDRPLQNTAKFSGLSQKTYDDDVVSKIDDNIELHTVKCNYNILPITNVNSILDNIPKRVFENPDELWKYITSEIIRQYAEYINNVYTSCKINNGKIEVDISNLPNFERQSLFLRLKAQAVMMKLHIIDTKYMEYIGVRDIALNQMIYVNFDKPTIQDSSIIVIEIGAYIPHWDYPQVGELKLYSPK